MMFVDLKEKTDHRKNLFMVILTIVLLSAMLICTTTHMHMYLLKTHSNRTPKSIENIVRTHRNTE